jgi:origin recognition complex subunit 4
LLPESETFDERLELFKELLKLPTPQESANYKKENLIMSKKVFDEFRLPFLRRFFDPSEFNFSKKYIADWNKSIDQLAKKKKVVSSIENMFDLNVSINCFKLFIFQIVSNLSENHPLIEESHIVKLAEKLLFEDDKVKLITGLSVLEVCILIAIKHHCEIYDSDPFNFEMILTRYNKFAYKSSTMQNIDREVVLKGFENLKVS